MQNCVFSFHLFSETEVLLQKFPQGKPASQQSYFSVLSMYFLRQHPTVKQLGRNGVTSDRKSCWLITLAMANSCQGFSSPKELESYSRFTVQIQLCFLHVEDIQSIASFLFDYRRHQFINEVVNRSLRGMSSNFYSDMTKLTNLEA